LPSAPGPARGLNRVIVSRRAGQSGIFQIGRLQPCTPQISTVFSGLFDFGADVEGGLFEGFVVLAASEIANIFAWCSASSMAFNAISKWLRSSRTRIFRPAICLTSRFEQGSTMLGSLWLMKG
jgi:hypothetical protein